MTALPERPSIEVSSTGSLGSGIRSEERYYTNNPYAVNESNIDKFSSETITNLAAPLDHPEWGVTRSVIRTIIDRAALEATSRDPHLSRYIEAVAPITSSNDLLAYFAKNYGDREPTEIVRQDIYSRVLSAKQCIARSQEIRLPSNFAPVEHWHNPEELATIWGETFGWSIDGCSDFLSTITEQNELAPHERTMWFNGISDGNRLVAATMAESLEVPSNTGPLTLIELTEWAVHPEYRGHGLGKFVVAHSVEAVESDLDDRPHLSFAEANVLSGAHQMALRAGLHIPNVILPSGVVHQVVMSNVKVGDGLEPIGQPRHFALVTTNNTEG